MIPIADAFLDRYDDQSDLTDLTDLTTTSSQCLKK